MTEHHLKTAKTARYFTLGNSDNEIETIWFVLHGYAQHAGYFIKKFNTLKSDSSLIVAPEGLHRFYQQGFNGRVVASWMTKEDRENDIEDYNQFLNQLSEKISSEHPEAKINVIGFSQGAATACRWTVQSKIGIGRLILWAGSFPPDIDLGANSQRLNTLNLTLVVGNQDQFINQEDIRHVKDLLDENKISYDLKYFEGKHEINPHVLNELSS